MVGKSQVEIPPFQPLPLSLSLCRNHTSPINRHFSRSHCSLRGISCLSLFLQVPDVIQQNPTGSDWWRICFGVYQSLTMRMVFDLRCRERDKEVPAGRVSATWLQIVIAHTPPEFFIFIKHRVESVIENTSKNYIYIFFRVFDAIDR